MVPQRSFCVDLLLQVVDVAQDSSRPATMEPGSRYLEEANADADIGDSTFGSPYVFTHMVVAALLYASAESLATLSLCVGAPQAPFVMSALDLGRAAARAATHASWLGNSDIDGEERLSRMLGLVTASMEEEHTAARENGRDDDHDVDALRRWGMQRGIRPTSPPPFAALLDTPNPDGAPAQALARMSERSMLFTHVGMWMQAVRAREDLDARAFDTDAWNIGLGASSSVLEACRHRRSVLGGGVDRIALLERSVVDWHRRLLSDS